MKKRVKRYLAWLLVVVLTLSNMQFTAFASQNNLIASDSNAEEQVEDGTDFKLEEYFGIVPDSGSEYDVMTDSDAEYNVMTGTNALQVCQLEEHIHTREDCYERELDCEHDSEEEHTADCFINEFICGYEEHIHREECGIEEMMTFSLRRSVNSSPEVEYEVRTDDYYKLISKKDYELAPGITEAEIILNNAEGSHRQVAHVVEIDVTNPYAKVMPSYKGMAEALNAKDYGTQVMSEQAAYAEENGYGNVVAAMNLSLSWYNSTHYAQHPELVGEPLGYLVMDGTYYENSQGKTSGAQTCLVINFDEKDGVTRPNDIPKTEIRSTSSSITGWEEQVIPANFGFLVKDGKNQYSKDHASDAASRSFVGIKKDGTIVTVMNDGRQAPYSVGFNSYEMAEFMLSLGCVQAINGDGGGSSTFLSQRPGEELTLNCSPSDGAERATTHGVLVITSAPADGEFVRAHITTDDQYYTPKSEVQFEAVGSDLVGTETEIPKDATWKLSDDKFGTIDENGLFTSSGELGEVSAQLIYNNEIVGEATVEIVIPDISFKQDTLVLPYGEAAELTLNITTNDGLNTVTTKEGDIVWTLSDAAMGTIEGNIFNTTTDLSVTGGTITAVICGDTEHAATATIKFGKASEIVIDFEDNYELIIDNSLTGGDEDADVTKNYYYGWHMGDVRIDQFYGYRWTGFKTYQTSIGVQMGKDMYLVDDTTGEVRNGEKALAVNIDWTSVTSMGSKQMNVWFPEPVDVSEATSAGLWVYVPDVDTIKNALTFRWCGYKKDGSVASINTSFKDLVGEDKGFSDEGWIYVSCDAVGNNLSTIEYFQIYANDASATYVNPMSNYTFYIDDVTVDYSEATIDRENPYFSSVTISNGDEAVTLNDGDIVSENIVTVFAQAKENTGKTNATGLDSESVKVTVDGLEVVNGVSVNAGGKVSVVDLELSNGVHTIRFEICDAQGNKGSVTRKLVVGSEHGDVYFELANPEASLLPAGSITYLNLMAKNISSIDNIITKVRLDGCNDWDLEGMEVAYGFEASYTVNANNEAFIEIERVSDEVADTEILAKLPVRVWMTSTYLNPEYIDLGYVKDDPALQDKYYALTPYAMWLSDGVSIIHLIMDASEGIVTYTDGEIDTFSSEKYDITTELNRYRNTKNAGDANFYQDKASFHIHKAGEPTSKTATCTEAGYTDRIFCVGCSCKTVEKYGHVCDTDNGCGSVIEWGEIDPATGHKWSINTDGKLACEYNADELYTGLWNGKQYVDGSIIGDGWIGDRYYRDGALLTGAHSIDGIFYNFDQDGISLGKITGLFFDEDDKVYRYAISGVAKAGWQMVDNAWHHFDDTYKASVGSVNMPMGSKTVSYVFEENGKVSNGGVWLEVAEGFRYYYGPDHYHSEWATIDGERYYFNDNRVRSTGIIMIVGAQGNAPECYEFAEDGRMLAKLDTYTGLVINPNNNKLYYFENGTVNYAGLIKIENDYYYINSQYQAIQNCKYNVSETKTNGLLPAGIYEFDATGKLVQKNGLMKDSDGEVRYYENGVAVYVGLVQDEEGNYYYINSQKKAVKGCKYNVSAAKTNGLLPAGVYEFDATGKLIIE